MITAAEWVPSTTAGRMSMQTLSTGSTNGDVNPLGGNQRSSTANTYTNSNACQKLGIATTPIASSVPSESMRLPGLTAEMMATDQPSASPNTNPAAPTYKLIGTRCISSPLTDSCVRID